MLRINRLKAISKTEIGNFGFDYRLENGLNLIASDENTRGKSSVLLTIYYCLGFEEIVGGKGQKTLTSVYKNIVYDENNTYNVLESDLFLEISNGTEIITIYRAGKMEGRSENLITVYFSDMDSIYNTKTYVEDMYVHSQNSTTSSKGFHSFLEKFLSLDLPLVPTNDDTEYKLYMQLIFSCIFIEQKRGWADLFSAMPIFSIRDAKKRVLEYVLALDTLSNEKKKAHLKQREASIQSRWDIAFNEVSNACNREDCRIVNLPSNPRLLDSDFLERVAIIPIGKEIISIKDKLDMLEDEYEALKKTSPKIVDNFDELQNELSITEGSICNLETEIQEQRTRLLSEIQSVEKLTQNLKTINIDIRNNKDALKLKNMGSDLQVSSYMGLCPLCHQHIEDTLLPSQNCTPVMSIEDNIKHLESQKDMLDFALSAHRKNKDTINENIQSISGRLFTLRRLAKAIRSDLFSVDEDVSETIVLKRIQIENKIDSLKKLMGFVDSKLSEIKELSAEWKIYLQDKEKIPKLKFSNDDLNKLNTLESYFKSNLKAFGYKSVSNFNSIQISHENYLPISEGFDMKFDSSASDGIRSIWAFIIALMQTSIATKGNHPCILLFDEPAQHSIVTEDVMNLSKTIISITGNVQVIFGITLNDGDIRREVRSIDKSLVNIVDVGSRAFKIIN